MRESENDEGFQVFALCNRQFETTSWKIHDEIILIAQNCEMGGKSGFLRTSLTSWWTIWENIDCFSWIFHQFLAWNFVGGLCWDWWKLNCGILDDLWEVEGRKLERTKQKHQRDSTTSRKTPGKTHGLQERLKDPTEDSRIPQKTQGFQEWLKLSLESNQISSNLC
jgi:hypothetical protein